MSRITLIAALDRKRAIGFDNALPWRLPDDLKRFKSLTIGKTVLMGRKTAESLGRALPERRNLVLTRSGSVPFEGMHAVSALEEALALCGDHELMVIGGGEIYALALPRAQQMHLTHVDTELPQADVWFPSFDDNAWLETSSLSRDADDRHAHQFRFADYFRLNLP
ncbi:dihydrofolate reductase [Arenimonas sp.]|jgi:dihydrofolate reductase|uniref:dihydrofolate reductase n=1 Tax=Arenimonas sp. TaxID=1872635 RepID=UPI0037BE8F1D